MPTSMLDPRSTALLVMDYQASVLRRFPQADTLVDRARRAIGAAREHGVRVGFVRVAFTDEDAARVPGHSLFAAALARAERQLHDESPLTAIDGRLAPRPDDIVVRKTRVGAFSTTDLDARLRATGVTTLVLAGLSTGGVVLSTVRDAYDRDYRLVVLADACADTEPGMHEFLVERILPRQSAVLGVAEFGQLLGAGARR